ncbi:MAG: iron-sulfur cluster-binding protein Rieske family [Cyanobacteria bacterium RYN_339]|nr:iron-sulfur cluster-binding protein Rieske family [Cyanobacteria bacterium RYN_339]
MNALAWYVACRADELARKPLARTLLGVPLVLFRDAAGRATALVDRCPHRNAPLSAGRLEAGVLRCPYHGWAFDGAGACVEVPGLCEQQANPARAATAHPVLEQDGLVWVWGVAGVAAGPPPYRVPDLTAPNAYAFGIDTRATLANAAENYLDSAHTAYVHAGLIRREAVRKPATVHVTRWHDRVEALYPDDQSLNGLIYGLLGRGVSKLDIVARFILPSIAELEYRTDTDAGMRIVVCFTPTEAGRLQGQVVVGTRWRGPGWLARALTQPLFKLAARQDAGILGLQADNVARFGDEAFVSTELDVVRSHIAYLLAHPDLPPAAEPAVQRTLAIMI